MIISQFTLTYLDYFTDISTPKRYFPFALTSTLEAITPVISERYS